MLKRIYQQVVTPAKSIESSISGGSELAQMVLPLLLEVQRLSQDDVPYVVTYAQL